MDWDKLRIFHEAARAGSFTHAGDVLNMSQSAISRQVSALEQEVGASLFHRHARGLLLTEQGELLYRTAHEVFQRIEAARARLAETHDRPSGLLRVHATVGLGSTWLASRLNEFLDLYPDIQVDLRLSDNELDIGMREADVAVRLRQPTQIELIQRRLFTVHFHVYAATAYLKKRGSPKTVPELTGHRLITFGESSPPYLRQMNWLEQATNALGEGDIPVLKVNNLVAMKRAVRSAAGLALLPEYLVENAPDLVKLNIDADLPTFDTYLTYSPELRNTARLKVFREFLISQSEQWQY